MHSKTESANIAWIIRATKNAGVINRFSRVPWHCGLTEKYRVDFSSFFNFSTFLFSPQFELYLLLAIWVQLYLVSPYWWFRCTQIGKSILHKIMNTLVNNSLSKMLKFVIFVLFCFLSLWKLVLLKYTIFCFFHSVNVHKICRGLFISLKITICLVLLPHTVWL